MESFGQPSTELWLRSLAVRNFPVIKIEWNKSIQCFFCLSYFSTVTQQVYGKVWESILLSTCPSPIQLCFSHHSLLCHRSLSLAYLLILPLRWHTIVMNIVENTRSLYFPCRSSNLSSSFFFFDWSDPLRLTGRSRLRTYSLNVIIFSSPRMDSNNRKLSSANGEWRKEAINLWKP